MSHVTHVCRDDCVTLSAQRFFRFPLFLYNVFFLLTLLPNAPHLYHGTLFDVRRTEVRAGELHLWETGQDPAKEENIPLANLFLDHIIGAGVKKGDNEGRGDIHLRSNRIGSPDSIRLLLFSRPAHRSRGGEEVLDRDSQFKELPQAVRRSPLPADESGDHGGADGKLLGEIAIAYPVVGQPSLECCLTRSFLEIEHGGNCFLRFTQSPI